MAELMHFTPPKRPEIFTCIIIIIVLSVNKQDLSKGQMAICHHLPLDSDQELATHPSMVHPQDLKATHHMGQRGM